MSVEPFSDKNAMSVWTKNSCVHLPYSADGLSLRETCALFIVGADYYGVRTHGEAIGAEKTPG